jgi:hypothetical protein
MRSRRREQIGRITAGQITDVAWDELIEHVPLDMPPSEGAI